MIEEAALSLRCHCQPPSDVQLSRTLCACGHMHFYCECGLHVDACSLEEDRA